MTQRLDLPHVGINDSRWNQIRLLLENLHQCHTAKETVRILEIDYGFKTTSVNTS